MKACQISPRAADGALHFVELPCTEPGAGEVLVRMRAASLNYRDLLVLDNMYGATTERLIPLSDGAGEIAAIGEGVKGLRIGDRVAGAFYPDWISGPISAQARVRGLGGSVNGVLAEFVVLPAHAAIPFPAHLTYEEAATLPCAALTAWNAMTAAHSLRAGETVVLQGSGGVSVMALQFAKLMGAHVIHLSSSPKKCRRLLQMGADATIDYTAEPDWDRRVGEMTDGNGADLVVEVGGPGTLERSFRAVRVGGSIITIGFVGSGDGINPRGVISRAIRLIGISVGSCAMFHEMNRAIGLHRLRPVVDEVFPFDRTADAYAKLRSGGHFGKLVISI